jgi:hypothetical protein
MGLLLCVLARMTLVVTVDERGRFGSRGAARDCATERGYRVPPP